MMAIAQKDGKLAKTTSYIQIELGLDELHAAWDGFIDTSAHYGVEFKSRKHLCDEFANTLIEYIEYSEPKIYQMGPAFYQNS